MAVRAIHSVVAIIGETALCIVLPVREDRSSRVNRHVSNAAGVVLHGNSLGGARC